MADDTQLDDLPQPEYEGTVPVDELETDGENPNEQNDETFGLLCDRMRDRGWLGGPIVTDTDGLIADGEHRWRAAQEIGLSEVPVKQYDIDDPTRRMVRQELNKISGEHDSKRDALEYDTLLSEGYTDEVNELVDATGEDLDELLAEIRMDNSRPAAYEYDPEHNVYFEDCVEGMKERLDDDSVDMVFTSPPYNVEKTAHNTRERDTVDYQDDMGVSEYRSFLSDVFSEVARVVKPTGHVFINHQIDVREGVVTPNHWLPELVPMTWKSYIVWNKNNTTDLSRNTRGGFHQSWEPIFHFTGDDPSPLRRTDHFSVWRENQILGKEAEETGPHPAPYPIGLVKKALDAATEDGDTILDPFMGSGTTAVAAIQNDRDYIGFELDEQGAYKPIIERRIGEAKRQVDADVNSES